jgi:hypothetical protein
VTSISAPHDVSAVTILWRSTCRLTVGKVMAGIGGPRKCSSGRAPCISPWYVVTYMHMHCTHAAVATVQMRVDYRNEDSGRPLALGLLLLLLLIASELNRTEHGRFTNTLFLLLSFLLPSLFPLLPLFSLAAGHLNVSSCRLHEWGLNKKPTVTCYVRIFKTISQFGNYFILALAPSTSPLQRSSLFKSSDPDTSSSGPGLRP